MAFTRTTTINSAPGGDSTKQAVLDLDTDLTGAFGHLNTLDSTKSATTHNHAGVYEPADATILKDADIGVNVAAQVHNHDSLYSVLAHNHDSLYSVLAHNHALNNLTEKSYNSLTDKPTIPSVAGLLDEASHDALDHTGLTGIPSVYTLPTASTTTLGGVKVDGSSIAINGSGVISASAGGISDGDKGDITVSGSGATWKFSRTGTAGQVLTSGGAGADPSYQSVISGPPYAFDKLSAQSVAFTKTAAGTASIKAGTQVIVGTTLVKFSTDTAITMPSHTIGNDYYIYACADGSIRADANATNPTGYDTTNSRKIGGYHYGRVRNTLTVTDVATEIVPRSLWDLTYRPKCNQAGMVDVYGNGSLWADIYLAAVDSAITLTSGVVTAGTCKSIYNGTPLSGTEGLHGYNFIELAKNNGKRLLTHSEWLAVAHGSPQGNNGDNLNAWSATTNSARTTTGQVARAVSFCGACDCVGNLWEWLDEWSNDYSTTVSAAWYNPMTSQNVGQQYLYNSTGLRMYIAGGDWAAGVIAGSRDLSVNNYPWNVGAGIGSRFACDGL